MQTFYLPDFQIKKTTKNENELVFTAAPLVQGFATTLGNSLRRVMMSSILGTAIFAFRIKGVAQEFQNLPGVTENVLQIALNVQKILLSALPNTIKEGDVLSLRMIASGKGEKKAKDIILPAGLQIKNPDLTLFSIVDENKKLEIEMWAYHGRGFSNFTESKELIKKTNINEVGTIALTANFSPILNVASQAEEIKVGEQTVIEKLTMTIKTNGTLKPTEALANAAIIFRQHLKFFEDLTAASQLNQFNFLKKEVPVPQEIEVPISQMNFSRRTDNALRSEGIINLKDLKSMKLSSLRRVKNLGAKSISEIIEKMEKEHDFKFDS